jgi:copper chaperone CopZ
MKINMSNSISKFDKDHKDETIGIKGMHCKSCAERIEKKLSRLKGVERVKVSLPDEQASVRYDPKQISVAAVEEEIRDLGYGAGPEGSFVGPGPSSSRPSGTRGGLLHGIAYGLVPHIGCIGFIVATVLGVTVATNLFKPLLMNPYFFYILIGVSFVFATVSSLVYLKNQGFITLSKASDGMEFNIARNTLQRKWKYLTTMYGSTAAINLLLFFFVFPALANLSFGQPVLALSTTGNVGAVGTGLSSGASLASIKLQVNIPCSGHAPLISGELKTLPGVKSVTFSGSNTFDVTYNPAVTSKADILGLDVFKTYAATVISESSAGSSSTVVSAQSQTQAASGSGGSCGCGS